jgi:hypothetical protein
MFGLTIDFPFYYSIICILLGVVYACFLYFNERLLQSKTLHVLLFAIRTIFVGILAFLLLSPLVKSFNNTTENPIVIIAQDVSESIADSTFELLSNLSNQLTDFDVHKFSFSEDVETGFQTTNIGVKTDYSSLFSDLENRFSNRNVAGIILASDGCYNSGNNPIFRQFDFPIYSIALGDTSVKQDVLVRKVTNNDIAFLGNIFPLEVAVSAVKLKGKKSKLSVWNKGIELYTEQILFDSNDDYKIINMQLEAKDIGLQAYKIVLSEVKGEKNIENNIFTSYIDVIDSRYNVLILKDKSHPDLASYISAIEKNKNYKIEINTIDEVNDFNKYHLVVFSGISQIPSSLIDKNIPLILFESLNFSSDLSSVKFVQKGSIEEIRVVQNELFSKFTFSPELLNLIKDAPPLYGVFGKYELNVNIDVVLKKKIGAIITESPLLFIEEIENRKVAFFTAEGWWKWKLYDYSINENNDAFNELFSKLTQYLLLQEDKSKFRIYYKKQVAELTNILFDANLYNESYELINNKEITLEIKSESGEEFDFQFSKVKQGYFLDIGILENGQHSFVAKVVGSSVVKSGVFDVKKLQLEQMNLVANHGLLFKISELSNGKLFYRNEIDLLSEELNKSSKNQKLIHSKEKLTSLINIPLILLSLLLLISTEWFVRKYNGLI